jgi:hypothetical protein
METLGWVLLVAMLLWHWQSKRYSAKLANNLLCYIVFLLLSDETREDHKRKFQTWVKGTEVMDPVALATKAHWTLQDMADKLAPMSVVASVGLIEQCKLKT